MKNKYLFYHIPKTAGTSFGNLISRLFDKEDYVNFNTIPNYNIDDYLNVKFLAGHFNNLSKTEKIFDDRFKIVFLREPISRFISQYYFLRNKKVNIDNPTIAKCKELEIEEYVNSFNVARINHTLNRQVCMLSDNATGSNQEQLEQAKRNLEKFEFVGLVENMDESIQLLSDELNWPKVKIGRSNTMKTKKPSISEDIISKIKELNKYDIELYNYAKELYKKRKIIYSNSMKTIEEIDREKKKTETIKTRKVELRTTKKILYYHIPKSAGTSIFKAFREYYGEKNVIQFPNNTNFNDNSIISEYKDKIVLGGHFRGFIEAEKVMEDRYLMTVLRDPVERFLSQYYYYKYNTPDIANDKSVALAKRYSIEEFIVHYEKDGNRISSFRNRQVNHLKNRIGFAHTPEIMLEQAKKNLEKFDLVGIYEELDRTIEIMKKDLQLNKNYVLPKSNASKNKEEISEKLKERIRKINELDAQLYEYAKLLFNRKIDNRKLCSKKK